MRDHPFHNALILGGMWGASSKIKNFSIQWEEEKQFNSDHGQDQEFLAHYLYPLFRNDKIIHDSFLSFGIFTKKFSTLRTDYEYVGESLAEDGKFSIELRAIIYNFDKCFLKRLKLRLLFLIKKILPAFFNSVFQKSE
jgi:hypothetical protein